MGMHDILIPGSEEVADVAAWRCQPTPSTSEGCGHGLVLELMIVVCMVRTYLLVVFIVRYYQCSRHHQPHSPMYYYHDITSFTDDIMRLAAGMLGLLVGVIGTAVATTIVSGFALPLSHATRAIAAAAETGNTRRHIAMTSTSSSTAATSDSIVASESDHVLYDVPVSNNGARCRIILYKKNISRDMVDIVSPASIGGLKSDAYLKLSPLGLMPCLVIHRNARDGGADSPTDDLSCLVESDTIARYLLSEYSASGPSFMPDDPRSNQICRWHDMYLSTIQGCLYKPSSRLPIGDYPDRKSAINAYRRNLDIIEGFVSRSYDCEGEDDNGTTSSSTPAYLCGRGEVSLADATLFPSCVFASYMLPKFDADATRPIPPLPPRLTRWFDDLRHNDEVFSKVYDEIMDTLVTSWESVNKRWDAIWLAGLRDTSPSTIFDKIISGDIPADIVRQDEHVLAFRDIHPMAPVHILVIPRDRAGLASLRKATAEHTNILGRMLLVAGEIANDESLGFGDGARIVINDGPDGGQEVNHLHVHVLGGRRMGQTFG
jgi:diadenosine tetraphosphate (Ap4A) HIT family hydrolase/glutathione S-transferase